MSIELGILDKLKARVTVARQIDKAQHKHRKENHEKNWMRETADAMEIELDSDFAR
jgi:ATP-dependent RNA helicase DDX24/MAK5